MPGPTIQWTPIDTTEVLSEIREEGRYRLASPSAVTGAPSLAMQAAGQNCTVKVYIGGVYRSDALLTVPSTAPVTIRNAVGQPLTGQEMFDMVIEVGNLGFGSVLLTTDEPNGSPSAPFTTEAERTAWATANLSSLLPGRTTAWGPGNVEYVWNGPMATDWQGIRGPYLGSAENPFPNAAALPASGAYIGDTKYLVSPNVPCGMVRREWCNGVWQTPAGGTILQKSNPLSLLNPGNTDAAILPIATIPINSVVDGDWEMILGYEQGAANTGTDNLGLDVNDVNLFSTGNVVAGAVPQLWSHLLRFVRMGTAIRIFYYQRLGGFVSSISGITIDFSVDVNLSWRAQPGNGANNLYLRNVAMRRVN